MSIPGRLPLLLSGALALAGCGGDEPDPVRVLSGASMGSTWEVKWHGSAAPSAVRGAVLAELELADATFSTWGRDSELQRFNAHRSNVPFAASGLLREAVALGLAVAGASDGAFDPTVKPLSDVYRAAKSGAPLDPEALAAARARVDHRALHVVGETLVKDRADLELDLDGLVAGLCADRMGARLCALGVAGFMLQITGEVLCHGRKPDGSPWQIGIDDPESSVDDRTAALTVPLLDGALCTSGDYRNFVIRDGKVFGHVFDPRTAQSPEHRVVSVSVLARSCALADALDTALLVSGPADAAAVLARCAEPTAGAWFVVADDAGNLRTEAVGWPEAFALDGRPLRAIVLPESEREPAERALAAAAAAALAAPGDPRAATGHGRCLAAAGRHREAVAVWSRALALHPDDPQLLRYRGEGYIVLRDFEAAGLDLARAGSHVYGRPAGDALRFEVCFFKGLAQFLQGDFGSADGSLRDALVREQNDERVASATRWLTWALDRKGWSHLAAALAPISVQPEAEIVAFGLAHQELVAGNRDRAASAFEQIVASGRWTSLVVIAAEAELQRLRRP